MIFKYLFGKNEDVPPGAATIFLGFSAIFCFIVGTGLGNSNAAKLAFPDFVTGSELFAFGHMRQVHVLAVILGWISGAFAMTMMHMTPSLGNTKLRSEKLGLWTALNRNIGLSLGRRDTWCSRAIWCGCTTCG